MIAFQARTDIAFHGLFAQWSTCGSLRQGGNSVFTAFKRTAYLKSGAGCLVFVRISVSDKVFVVLVLRSDRSVVVRQFYSIPAEPAFRIRIPDFEKRPLAPIGTAACSAIIVADKIVATVSRRAWVISGTCAPPRENNIVSEIKLHPLRIEKQVIPRSRSGTASAAVRVKIGPIGNPCSVTRPYEGSVPVAIQYPTIG